MTTRSVLLAAALGLAGCAGTVPRGGAPSSALGLAWAAVDSLDARLPDDVRVFAGASSSDTLRAWAVRLGPGVRLGVEVAADTADGREAPTAIAVRTGACVVLNGGYFNMETGAPVGLVVDEGRVRSPAFDVIERDSVEYTTARGAVGVAEGGRVEIAWARDDGAAPCRLDAPLPNRRGSPVSAAPACSAWAVPEAVGAGPVLVRDGHDAVATEAEVFFGTSIPDRHPRSAVGVGADGAVWLVVVDGRQPLSRGVTLEELALLMRGLGSVDALNLDGGGSSALVVQPRGGPPVRLNVPVGGVVEREVSTALVAACD